MDPCSWFYKPYRLVMANSMGKATMSPHLSQIKSIILCYLSRNLLVLHRDSAIIPVITFFYITIGKTDFEKIINELEYRKYLWLEVPRKFPVLIFNMFVVYSQSIFVLTRPLNFWNHIWISYTFIIITRT